MSFSALIEDYQKEMGRPTTAPLSSKEIEIVYSGGYALYNVGDYERGADLFTHLILHDPYQVRFWKGLASCRQMAGQFANALRGWANVALLDPKCAMAHLHAAECYVCLEDFPLALSALELATSSGGLETSLATIATQLRKRIDDSSS